MTVTVPAELRAGDVERALEGAVERIRASVEAAGEGARRERRVGTEPQVALVLGTGLGGLAGEIDVQAEIPYQEIPGFLPSTVETHAGRLLLGTLEGVRVAGLDGRVHRYEGHSLQEITFPIRVLGALGAETLVVTGACGGMHPLWGEGDLVLLSDQINLMGDNPLVGPNVDSQGPRFPDMSEAFDAGLRALAREEALRAGTTLREGVYVAVPGPSLETAAEYRMLRAMGADVVGMSLVPEVIVARHAGMRVLGLCIVTDVCLPDALEPADVKRIIAVARAGEPTLSRLVRAVLARL